jgi:hypothetical protein
MSWLDGKRAKRSRKKNTTLGRKSNKPHADPKVRCPYDCGIEMDVV